MASRRWLGAKGSGSRRELQEEMAEDVLEGLDEYDISKRPEVRIINRYARFRTGIMLLFKAVGSLALLWSTLVILRGFVTLLKEVDFWYLTFIGIVQAAGIFNAFADDQFVFVLNLLLYPIAMLVSWIKELQNHMLSRLRGTSQEVEVPKYQVFWAFYEISLVISFWMMQMVILILHSPVILLYFGVPYTCLLLSVFRLTRQDYGSVDGDPNKANLKPALNIFYSLAVAQAVLYMFWTAVERFAPALTRYICTRYGYECGALDDYITETKRKCVQDMALADDWNLITYALSLLDSESPDSDEYYCSGLRILHALIEEKVPVSRLLIRSSRQRIQKLISMLGSRRPADWETRELAALILAHLANDLSLADFPGALEFVSSLLETHCYRKDQEYLHVTMRKNRRTNRKKSVLQSMMEEQMGPNQYDYIWSLGDEQGIKIRQGTKEELILQGLRIVENLAHNELNCTEIYKNKDLLLKITAPVSSDKFIEEVESLETNGGCSVRMMDGTLKVVSRLIGAYGDIGKNMRQDIAGNSNTNMGREGMSSSEEDMTAAVRNLVAILGLQGNSNILGLQTRAIEILAQLFLDESTNLDIGERKKFIERLLQFFLSEKWMSKYLQEKQTKIIKEATTSQGQNNNMILWLSLLVNELVLKLTFAKRKKTSMEEQAKKKMEEAKEIASQLKVKAGEALALLSMGSQSNSNVIMNFTGCGDVKHILTKMLDSKIKTIKWAIAENEIPRDILIKIGCRISAAEILKHLCAHSTGDHSSHKTVLIIKKVLEELLPINTTRNAITGSSSAASTTNDIENPRPPSSSHQDEPQTPGSNKQRSDRRRFQAALLSLYAAIRATWSDSADFACLVAQLVPGNDFAVNIKAIVKENSYGTPACLAILKIICEMVILLVQHDHYVQDINDEKIIDALSEASKTMASLEGCMFFAGMGVDCYGVPLKPVYSSLVTKAQEVLDSKRTGVGQ